MVLYSSWTRARLARRVDFHESTFMRVSNRMDDSDL